MSEILMLDDIYPYQLPNFPTDEKKFLYHDLPKDQQYWRRPRNPNLKKMSLRDQCAFIDEERRRLDEGLFLMINGVHTWITPSHYDFLRYSDIPDFDGDPSYYNSQRLDFYFKDFYEQDPNSFGELTIKPRRYGYTAMDISDNIHKVMKDFGRQIGIGSTNLDKVKETQFRPMMDSLLSRPSYVRPEIYMPGGRIPQKELRLRRNIIGDKDDEEESDESFAFGFGEGLRGWISPRSTTAKMFDGHKWHKVTLDEIFKWTEAQPYNTWKITKEALQVGGRIIGKGAVYASMGDDDDYDVAVKDGIKMWADSDYNKRNNFGRTVTGLYRHFISAVSVFELFMDKFGNCNESLAREYLEEERASFDEGTKEYIYHVRKYPFTAEEALASAENSSVFSNLRLTAQQGKIYILGGSAKPYTTGNFHWDITRDLVEFKPTPKGYWKMGYQIPAPARNRCQKVKGRLILPRNPEGAIGNDPVRTAQNVSGHLSQNAAFVYQRYDYFNSGNSNRILAQLYGRDEDVDVFNEQIRLASLYYAYPVMTERQITSTYDWFRQHFMESFLLRSEYDNGIGLFMSGKIIEDGIELIQGLIKKPSDPEAEDYLQYIVYEELIEQLKQFEKGKSTKYDAVMGLIMTLIGVKQIKYTIVSEQAEANKLKVLNALFPYRQ
jgi:hypothetical protein